MADYKVLQKCFINDSIAEVDDIIQLEEGYPCFEVLEFIPAPEAAPEAAPVTSKK